MINAEMPSTSFVKKSALNCRSFTSKPSSFVFPTDNSSLAALHEGKVILAFYVDNDYHLLTPQERVKAFEIISHPTFVKKHSDDWRLLKARFNPRNQYIVKTFFQGKENVYQCFKFEGKFHTAAELFVNESNIKEVVLIGKTAGQKAHF